MPNMVRISLFLGRVYLLARQNDEDTAIDEIFNFIDDALLAGNFLLCAETLACVDTKKLPASLLVSFLMISKAATDMIPSRALFFSKALETVSAELGQQYAESLLNKYR